MFHVSLEILTEVANKLHTDSAQLRCNMDELQNVISSLIEFSYMDICRERLMHEMDCIESEASKADLCAQSLSSIQEQYWRADRRAGDFCEEMNRVLPREMVSIQDVGWLSDYMEILV